MNTTRTPYRSRSSLLLGVGLLLITLLAPACKLFRKTVEFPGQVLDSDGSSSKKASPTYVQTIVMRFADTYHARIVQATNEFSAGLGTPEARIQALNWRIGPCTAAMAIATGPNPNANLLDMLVLVTLARAVHEEYWQPEVWKEADQPMVAAYQELDAEIWELASEVLNPRQIQEVHDTITEWRAQHPGKALTGFVRLPNFKNLFESRKEKSDVFQQLADLLSLDPFDSLEPATREATAMRALAERTLYWVQRAPLILQAQTELIALKTMRLDDVQTLVQGSERFSLAAAGLAETAKTLPEELDKQREALLNGLSSAQEPASRILADARTTIEAAKQMSVEVREGIGALDAFVERVSVTRETRDRERPDPEEPRHEYDVREYGEAAAQVGAAAQKLDRLITRFDEQLPETKAAVEEVADRSDQTIRQGLMWLLLVGLALIGAASVAVLTVKRIGARWERRTWPALSPEDPDSLPGRRASAGLPPARGAA